MDRLNAATSIPLQQTFTLDGDGNRLSQGGSYTDSFSGTLSYNDAGRLTALQQTGSGQPITFIYNALGQRIHKTSPALGNRTFMYDEAGHLLGEYDDAGHLIEEMVWLGDVPVASLRPDGSGGVAVYYVHTDHLNTPRKISRPSDNALLWRWDSDAFGNGAPNQSPSGVGTSVSNVRSPGQYYDAETALVYNYLRDYDPATGRYVESDPIGLRGGKNTYAYVGNDPLLWSDPYGLKPWDWDGYGDATVCQHYDDLAAKTPCPYYKSAASTCRAQRNDINLLMKAGIADAWHRNTTTASESAIFNAIRNGLVNGDKAARASGKTDCQGCVKGNAIDAYHEEAFMGAGINPFWYGGNQWPQGVWPNFVPYDPENKPRYDPRRLLN